MEYVSVNSFILGALLFGCLYLSNLIYSLLCIAYKIKIIEFSLFFNPWFSLHSETVFGTKFILGWLPLGGYIKPLGFATDKEEKDKISQSDLQVAFFNKPRYLQIIFKLVPWLVYLISFLIALGWFANLTNLSSEINYVINFIIDAFSAVFSTDNEKEKFIIATKEIISGKNVIVFAFMLLTFLLLLFTPVGGFMNWLSSNENRKSTIQTILGFVIAIGILWVMFWRIPKFVFSFFTFSQSLIYISSFLAGMFSLGLVFYFITLFVVKNISQKLTENRIQ